MTEEAQMAEEAPGVSTPSKPLPAPIFAAMFSKVGASMSPEHSRDQAKDIAARARLKASKADKGRLLTEKQQKAAAKLRKRSIHSPMDLTDTPGPESPASKKPCKKSPRLKMIMGALTVPAAGGRPHGPGRRRF
jgi:hypothetical protein